MALTCFFKSYHHPQKLPRTKLERFVKNWFFNTFCQGSAFFMLIFTLANHHNNNSNMVRNISLLRHPHLTNINTGNRWVQNFCAHQRFGPTSTPRTLTRGTNVQRHLTLQSSKLPICFRRVPPPPSHVIPTGSGHMHRYSVSSVPIDFLF